MSDVQQKLRGLWRLAFDPATPEHEASSAVVQLLLIVRKAELGKFFVDRFPASEGGVGGVQIGDLDLEKLHRAVETGTTILHKANGFVDAAAALFDRLGISLDDDDEKNEAPKRRRRRTTTQKESR